MIDVSKITYSARILGANNVLYDADALLQNMAWEDNDGELAQRASLTYADRPYGNTWLSSIALPGAYVYIYSDWGEGKKELFRGPIFVHNSTSDVKGEIDITAYDNLIYLEKSKDYRWYAAGTSSKTILLDIFKAWGIPVGQYSGPTIAIGKKVFKGESLANMVLDVLDDAKKRGDGPYIIRFNQGKIDVVKKGGNSMICKFEAGINAESVDYSMDISNLVTRVKVIGTEDKSERAPVEAIVSGRTEFGILQDIVQRSQEDTLAAAKSAAQEILRENGAPKITRKLRTPDVPFLRKGDKVYIDAGRLSGYYYVASIQHNATWREMTMEVEE